MRTAECFVIKTADRQTLSVPEFAVPCISKQIDSNLVFCNVSELRFYAAALHTQFVLQIITQSVVREAGSNKWLLFCTKSLYFSFFIHLGASRGGWGTWIILHSYEKRMKNPRPSSLCKYSAYWMSYSLWIFIIRTEEYLRIKNKIESEGEVWIIIIASSIEQNAATSDRLISR